MANSKKPVAELSTKVQQAFSYLAKEVEKARTFEEISNILLKAKMHFPQELDNENILVVDGIRIAYALDVYIPTEEGLQPIRIFRTEEIECNKEIPKVNLFTEDVIIASRHLLPFNFFGLFGKAANTRGRPELYEKLKVKVYANKVTAAYEVNEENGEHCAMVCAKVIVKKPGSKFIEALKTSSNISIGSDPHAEKTSKICA